MATAMTSHGGAGPSNANAGATLAPGSASIQPDDGKIFLEKILENH